MNHTNLRSPVPLSTEFVHRRFSIRIKENNCSYCFGIVIFFHYTLVHMKIISLTVFWVGNCWDQNTIINFSISDVFELFL